MIVLSCSKDDSDSNANNSSLIIGKWSIVKSTDSSPLLPCDLTSWSEFKKGGTGNDYDDCTKETASVTWSITGDVLTVTSSTLPIPFAMKIVSLTQTSMVLSFSDFGGVTSQTTYKRIN